MAYNSLPPGLRQALKSKQVHLFVGAGVSVSAGMIGWDGLIKKMKRIIKKEKGDYNNDDINASFKRNDPLEIAYVFAKIIGEYEYFGFLKEHFRLDLKLSPLHRVITSLPVKRIFTTNYDKLLEKAYRANNGIDPPVIIYPEQFGYFGDTEIQIIKIHGDIDHPQSIVLRNTDYADYEKRHKEFITSLSASINNHTLLFVGFGLGDPNFERIYNNARVNYGGVNRLSYAIMVGTDKIKRDIWEEKKLKIISVTNYKNIPTILKQLVG